MGKVEVGNRRKSFTRGFRRFSQKKRGVDGTDGMDAGILFF